MLAFTAAGRTEQFDYYTQPVLAKAVKDSAVKEVKQLTSDQIGDFTSALPDSSSAFLIVSTNDRRLAKLLVQPARQKIGPDKQVPMLLIDKFITFKGTTERAIQASGRRCNCIRHYG